MRLINMNMARMIEVLQVVLMPVVLACVRNRV